MTDLALEKDIIVKRIEGIEAELSELKKLAQFHLHRTLEGVFNISSHILSRIPEARPPSIGKWR